MSRITQKSAVAPLSLFAQAYSANPSITPVTTPGTGFADGGFDTYIGQKFDLSDGREVALVANGAVALASGKLVQAPVQVTAFQKLAMTVPAAFPATAGSFQVLVTNGATKLNVNQFQGGYFTVDSGTGIGQTLKISSHQPAAASATFVVTLEDSIVTTLDATSTVSFNYNPYAGVVITNHSVLGLPVGASLYPLAASTAPTYDATSGALTLAGILQYGFIVTGGPAGVLIDSTVTNVGYPLGPSAVTDGALGVATLTASPQIAVSGQTQTSAHTGIVYLQL